MSQFTESTCGICGVTIVIPTVAQDASGIKPVCFNCFKAQRLKQ